MKFLRYRMFSLRMEDNIYFLEAEIQLDNDAIFYVNMSVNNEGKKIVHPTGSNIIHSVPLDQLKGDNSEKHHHLSPKDYNEIFDVLTTFWNQNPVFEENLEWKLFKTKKLSEIFKDVTDEEMLEMYKDYIGSKELGIRPRSMDQYVKEIKDICHFDSFSQATEFAVKLFLEETAMRYYRGKSF